MLNNIFSIVFLLEVLMKCMCRNLFVEKLKLSLSPMILRTSFVQLLNRHA